MWRGRDVLSSCGVHGCNVGAVEVEDLRAGMRARVCSSPSSRAVPLQELFDIILRFTLTLNLTLTHPSIGAL